MNNLEKGKFSRVLSRVLQKLHLKVGVIWKYWPSRHSDGHSFLQSERAFTADEEEKLQGALQLEPKELELVINTTTFILQQAAYHLAKPTVLKTHLASIGLEEEKVSWVDVVCR